MAYGTIKVDTITFTDAGVDKSVTISGLVQNPTFSGNITVTGTVSGNTIQGQTVSGATITGGAAAFATVTGGVATITSGVFALGSASNPSISFNGDANSGLYSPGADQVAVSTGGTGRLFVDASGNVGVGTSSVNALLEVNNSTAGGEVQRIEGNYDGSGSVILTNWRRAGGSVAAALKYNDDSSPLCMSIGTTTSHEFRIRTADTDAITIDASQRVGIGTSAPQATLHANGAILSSGALVALSASNIFFDQPTSALSRIGVVGANTSTAGALRISQYSSDGSVGRDVFSIDDQGRVGIGTTSPAAPLDVNGAIYSRSTGVYTDAITAYGGSSLAVNAGSSNLNITVNASERARIDSSGRLLVGTSSSRSNAFGPANFQIESSLPSSSLHANSDNAFGAGFIISKTRGSAFEAVTNGDSLGIISFQGGNGSALLNGANISAVVDGAVSGGGANDLPTRLVFSTTSDGASSPTERLRITSAGLVGIGTSSPSNLLHVSGTSGTSTLFERTGSNGVYIALKDNSGFFSFIGSTNGVFSIQTPGSSYSDKLVVTSTGNVGIGTTSPGAPLEVIGTAGTISARATTGVSSQTLQIYNNGTDSYIDSTAYGAGSGGGIVFRRNGSGEMGRWDTSGRLLIGTSSASLTNKFLLQGDTSSASNGGYMRLQTTNSIIAGTSLGSIGFGDSANNGALIEAKGDVSWSPFTKGSRLEFSTTADGASSPTERMRITSAGNVGIGTTSPSSLLELSGVSNPQITLDGTTTSGYRGLIFAYDGTGFGQIGQNVQSGELIIRSGESGQSGYFINFSVNGSDAARIDSSGRLLVGTSTSRAVQDFTGNGPESLIQIEATNSNAIMSIISAGTADAGRAGTLSLGRHRNATVGGTPTIVQSGDLLGAICFAGGDGTDMLTKGAAIACQVDGTPGANDMPGRLVFSTTSDGASSPTERLRITSAGNVGIGTTSPERSLEIYNSSHATLALTSDNAGQSSLFFADTDTNVGQISYFHSDNAMTFRVNDGERARIDSSGRLLVGTSTSALEKLVVLGDGGGIQINRGSATPTSGQALGSIGFKGVVSANSNAAAEVLIQASADEAHSGLTAGSRLEFYTKPSGTGPGSSPTERMRITKTGATGVKSVSGSDTLFITNEGGPGTTNYFIRGAYGSATMFDGVGAFGVYTNGNVVNTNNSYGAISDVKLKENIVDASSQWDDLKALQIRNYNFKEGQTHTQIGLVAQEAELVSPGLVSESPDRDEDGNDLGTVTKSVNYSVLYMKAVKALQEAMERIEVLEQRLNDAGIN
jgi:hypothetical protein